MPLTIEQLARDILTEPVPTYDYGHIKHRFWVAAAQAYLDNLEEGDDDPGELIELLAQEAAAEDMPDSFPDCDAQGYSWHDGPYSEEQWLREEMPSYIAAVRSTYGMGAAV